MKCIICGKEMICDGGTELDGVRYYMHLECYKNSNEKILRQKVKEKEEKEEKCEIK